ncbi:MAG: pilus assembly protein PilM [Vicinamibacterales bacterium]
MLGFGRAKTVVGLDIGSSAVKAVELRAAGKGYRVAAIASEPIPPDSIVDGAIIDGGAVADAIRRLFGQKAFKAKEVAASLSGNAVIVKKISLPVMTEHELAESIAWEAEQYIPFDIQDVNLDYQVIDPAGADRNGTMDVLLVAAKKRRSLTTRTSSRRPAVRRWSSTSTRSRCRTPTRRTTAPARALSFS